MVAFEKIFGVPRETLIVQIPEKGMDKKGWKFV
jgi:hypothetical protein